MNTGFFFITFKSSIHFYSQRRGRITVGNKVRSDLEVWYRLWINDSLCLGFATFFPYFYIVSGTAVGVFRNGVLVEKFGQNHWVLCEREMGQSFRCRDRNCL